MLALLAGCANPLNQVTAERYSQQCIEAEGAGQLSVAEQACYRALVNVDIGKLGDHQNSMAMYNLARVKRKVGKLDEAESLLKESIAIEEKQTPVSNEKLGRRFAEIAMAYGQQKQTAQGLPYVERLYPMADSYEGKEKVVVATIFYVYSQELPQGSSKETRAKLAKKAIEMGFDPATYDKWKKGK